ncbi:putative pleiotropic drug resistance protein 3 [Coccomyxa subellipsoidea C-169]|uniref:Pleiotropic drug resistance protein 3 n=1 Tax=Coccomyxa subellipsoidea (strain C-169) TaxID=574566 RepID=I0YHY7_COCSC|nr:putative pleiotropic drug resistance protein 3 [Coccomyxa subellipsoidea C-169]EIE18006.1 putative pleiotropic drug resistance protein 3 [Coccomyxa subellipsoidea C-169]|eukprot:XP_005642550.1 putative pleiotropic drug resistance protein 3 [Coccomyxa subellipsoidea C-169]
MVVDLKRITHDHRQLLVDRALQTRDQDNEAFMHKLRARIDRTGVELPTVTVQYEGLNIGATVHVGGRALPSVLNAYRNAIEGRLTLLLGPPGAGKTTLLKALAGKLQRAPGLQVDGRIAYNGETFDSFFAQRTAAYVDQVDSHLPELTVRETLDFASRVQGPGSKRAMLREIRRRERELRIQPDADLDGYLKASALSGQRSNAGTLLIMRLLGLEVCQDTQVGSHMVRGISGGQRKRVTTGEMIVGPKKTMFLDEISTGLDSSTTFLIVKCIRNITKALQATVLMALLQPPPEVYDLFDDILLLCEGHVVFHGPREEVLPFFSGLGFRLPERKGVADFLQEVTSAKDQQQYWADTAKPYDFVPVAQFAAAFEASERGPDILEQEMQGKRWTPYICIKALGQREGVLMLRHAFTYKFRTAQNLFVAFVAGTLFAKPTMHTDTAADAIKFSGVLFFALVQMLFDGFSEMSMLIESLPDFYKQRDNLFYPAWAFALPVTLLRIPYSLVESFVWSIIIYWSVGLAPSAARFFVFWLLCLLSHQVAINLFRLIGAIGRSVVIAFNLAWVVFILIMLLCGYTLVKPDIPPWYVGGYWALPLQWLVNAIINNEFQDERWAKPDPANPDQTLAESLYRQFAFHKGSVWIWVGVGVVLGWIVLLNIATTLALMLLDDEVEALASRRRTGVVASSKGMVLPFRPLSLAFSHVYYSVDLPPGVSKPQLTLLTDISGAFRPGVLTCLMGVSGAGKTTLLDLLAGRKTGGLVRGAITVDGHPKEQATFARISGYVEQFDIHSPATTVREALAFSAELRLADVQPAQLHSFVDEVMELMELGPLRNALVGVPGRSGLSVEQRKRLTIGVELVANPSIVFLDEPTSGLDARAAAIVMRTIRNTVDTGRTVVCTIHQPSIDIFEAFDELLLLKRGGRVIYGGPTGDCSRLLVSYFQAVPGVPPVSAGVNPATWMLEVTSLGSEQKLGVDFSELYTHSDLARSTQEMVARLQVPDPNSQPLHFDKQFSRSLLSQFRLLLLKNFTVYWRTPEYNAVRMLSTTLLGLLFGSIYWHIGGRRDNAQTIQNIIGALVVSAMFIGTSNASTVQPVVDTERTVFYRERAAGYYSEYPFAAAQAIVELPYLLVQSILFSVTTYFMVYFEINAGKFFWYVLFIFLTLAFFTFYGMMTVSLVPNIQVASIVSSTFYAMFFLFAGFIVPQSQMPPWWSWYSYLNPLSYSIQGLLGSQLGDVTDEYIVYNGERQSVAQYLKTAYNIDRSFIGWDVLILVGFTAIFAVITMGSLRLFNFQKR